MNASILMIYIFIDIVTIVPRNLFINKFVKSHTILLHICYAKSSRVTKSAMFFNGSGPGDFKKRLAPALAPLN